MEFRPTGESVEAREVMWNKVGIEILYHNVVSITRDEKERKGG